MTKRKKNGLTAWIIGAISVVVLIVVVAVALVMSGERIDESFFVSDDTKSVLAFSTGDGLFDLDVAATEWVPEKAYLVYFYSDDKVSGLSTYYKYADNATAKKAAESMKEQRAEDDEDVAKIAVNGDYVIVTMTKEFYGDGMTAEEAKQQIEFMQILQKMNFDDYLDDAEDEVEIDVEVDDIEE